MPTIKELYEAYSSDRNSIPEKIHAIEQAAIIWQDTPDQIDHLMEILKSGVRIEFVVHIFREQEKFSADFFMPFLRRDLRQSLPWGRDDSLWFLFKIVSTWSIEAFWFALLRIFPELKKHELRRALNYPLLLWKPEIAATSEQILQLHKAAEQRFLSDDCPDIGRVILEHAAFGPNGWLKVREKAQSHPDERIRRLDRTVREMPKVLVEFWIAHRDGLWSPRIAEKAISIPLTTELWDWFAQALDHHRLSSFVASLLERREALRLPERVVRAVVRRARLAERWNVSHIHGSGGWLAERWALLLYEHLDETVVSAEFLSGSVCWTALHSKKDHSYSATELVNPDKMERSAQALSATGLVVFDIADGNRCVGLWGEVWLEIPHRLEYKEQLEPFYSNIQKYASYDTLPHRPEGVTIAHLQSPQDLFVSALTGFWNFSCHWEGRKNLVCYFIRPFTEKSEPFQDWEVQRALQLVGWKVDTR